MKFIFLLLFGAAFAYSWGVRIHPENLRPDTIKDISSWLSISEKDNFWIQRGIIKSKKKVPALRPGTSAWGKRERKYSAPTSSNSGYSLDTVGQAAPKAPPKGSMMDIINRAQSPEAMQAWAKDTKERLESTRNPLFEAFRSMKEDKKSSATQ